MNRMGGSCSAARHHHRSVHHHQPRNHQGVASAGNMSQDNSSSTGRKRAMLEKEGDTESIGSSASSRRYRLIRHSVESEIQDKFISNLYPVHQNYIMVGNYRRSPKSLKSLCIDAVCRSLPDLDGELPAGLPQELVNDVVESLITHAALNSTTLKALKNCEVDSLCLSECRGVRDEWFKPFSPKPTRTRSLSCSSPGSLYSPPPPLCRASFDQEDQRHSVSPLELDGSGKLDFTVGSPSGTNFLFLRKQDQAVFYQTEGAGKNGLHDLPIVPKLNHGNHDEESSSSSSSAETFLSANSSPLCEMTMDAAEYGMKMVKVSFAENGCSKRTSEDSGFWRDDEFDDKELYDMSVPDFHLGTSAIAANLTVLDLRGSQRLTDRGLLQLSGLLSLEVALLDHCHSIVGKGMVAFAASSKLHTLSLANCRRLTDEAILNVSHLPALESLSLDGCRCITDHALVSISNLRELRRLDLSQCDLITDEGIAELSSLELLEELSLGWCRSLSDSGIKSVCEQPGRSENLRVLRLSRCDVYDEGLDALARLMALQELDLNGCSSIGSSSLGNVLSHLKNLRSLDVSYCPGILRSSWQGKIDQLETLDLCYSGVKDSHMARLTYLPALKELNLDSCLCGDWTLSHLADNNVMPNLESLDLADTNVTDSGLAHIAKFRKLKRLSLFYCNITNQGLRHISTLRSLEELNLDSRDIGDEGLAHLVDLPNLRSLDVFSGRITHLGCVHLSKITSLESLELCGGGISDRGCAHLASLENLVSLNLSQNEHITNRGAAALAALSNLKCLNLSNTRVTSGALRFLSSLTHLKSLAMYGCNGLEDRDCMNALQNALPSLKCLRLNNGSDDRELWDDDIVDFYQHTDDEMDESD